MPPASSTLKPKVDSYKTRLREYTRALASRPEVLPTYTRSKPLLLKGLVSKSSISILCPGLELVSSTTFVLIKDDKASLKTFSA